MRIAYVSSDLGVPIFGRKGCSIHAQEVLAALLRAGAQVELFTTRGEGERPPDLEPIALHFLPCPPKGDPAAREQAALAGNALLRNQLTRSGSFDLIYERYSLWSFGGMEFARERHVPGLLEVNAPLIDEQAQYRVLVDRAAGERAAERAFRAATALLAVSDEVAAWLESFPAARGKISVTPNGVRPERFPADLKPSLPGPEGTFTVGFVGTLKAWHGLSVLVEAFAQLRASYSATRLLVVGDGPERERLAEDLAQRGLESAAHLTGVVAPEAVPGLLASMDVAVAPYPRLDAFYFSPLKLFEYMAAGRAVVASGIGQVAKIIESGLNGILVPPGDARALADALAGLLSNPILRSRLGSAARETVLRSYTWDEVAARILQLATRTPAKPAHPSPALA
jgi:glycosyltransferase involved in cell wall biosynthesis